MNKTKKLMMSLISLVLIITMMFSLTTPAFAQTETAEVIDESLSYTATSDEAASEQGNIVGEDVTKRDEYTKHFITDAGTTIAAQYAFPVHYKNADGEYVDYDNRLIDSEVESSTATADEATSDEISTFSLRAPTEAPQTEEVFTNKKSNSKVAHFKKSGKAKLVEITRDGHTISWGYSGANIVDAQKVESASEKLTGNDAFLNLPNLSSTVLYENIYNNIDLEVINSTFGVKENIILKAKNAKNVFNIEYSIGDLAAESKDAHTVVFKDAKGQEKYTITAPFMQDANGAESEALELKILKNNKGKLSLKLTADKKWLKDSSRAYPVTIDPTFEYGQGLEQMQTKYINSAAANTQYTEGSIYVGRPDETSGIHRSLIKLPQYPPLNHGDMVVDARFVLWQSYNEATITMYAGIYESSADWTDQSSVTWNNQPGYSSELIDYEKCKSTEYGWRDWNITELVKNWYNGEENKGFYLVMLNEADTYQGLRFISSNYPTDENARPELLITYRNNKGLEGYWDYTTISAGTAGVAYINNYSGNLVFQTTLADTHGPKLPISFGYTYNSYSADKKYKISMPYTGKGWQMNIQETLFETTTDLLGNMQSQYPYVYTDSDTTEHYFYKTTKNGVTKYIDEDGLGLELTINSNSTDSRYVITDKDKFTHHFKSNGLLSKLQDSSGNSVVINYSESNSKLITSITDGDGNTITINCDEKNTYVRTMQDPSGRTTSFLYGDKARLSTITYPDGTKATFEYDADNGQLTKVTNPDGTGLIFTYSQYGSKGVTSVQEFATENDARVLGQKMSFDRSKYNTTTIRTAGKDGTYGNSNDILNIYQFDNWGRTTAVNSQLKSGSNLSAGAATYTSGQVNSTGSNIGSLNRVSSSFSMGANRENLVKNHNMESKTNWKTKYWITDEITFTSSTNTDERNVLYGQGSLAINATASSVSGRGRVYQDIDAQYLTQGTTYTLSAYVKTENIQPVSGAVNYGAVIAITPRDSDSSTTDIYSDYIRTDTDPNVNKGFRRLSVTFTMPTTDTFEGVRVQLALRGAKGTAYFDGVQLEKASDAPSSYNFLENASFERTVANDLPENWDSVNIPNRGEDISFESTVHRHEKKSVIFSGAVKNKRNIFQEVPVSGSEADTYILSGWAKAPSVPNETNSSCFELRAKIYYADGTDTTKRAAKFNTTIDDWQFTSFAFNLDDGDSNKSDKPIKIGVYLIYYYQGNEVRFDNIQLTKEPVPSYTYDKDGNLISVVANAEQNAEYEYEDNRLTEYTDPKGGEYTYDYDSRGLLKTATNQSGATYSFTYDNAGNPTSMVGSAANLGSIKTGMSYSYPTQNGLTYSVTASDQDGKTTTETYNSKTGTLQSVKDVNNKTTLYTYDEDTDRLEGITRENQSVSYTYDTYGKLTGISHGDTSYTFAYDQYGLRTTTKVGSRTLSTNSYNANHSLASVAYGNGHTKSYTYDNFGNAATVAYNGTTAVKNLSDASGNIVRTQDLLTNLEHRVSYDSTGRLISKDVLDLSITGTADKWLRSIEYDFDENNNVTKLALASKNGNNTITYTYGDDNLLSKTTLANGRKVTYTHDAYGRLTRKKLDTSTNLIYDYTYMQSQRGTSYTTTKLETESIGSNKYRYTYDVYGNIKSIYSITSEDDPGTLLHMYMYDSANQLITDIDAELDRFVDYGYDESGNIVQKRVSALVKDGEYMSRGAEISRDTYSYTDSTWKDLLTSYNGQTITYDTIGNPLNYRDGITLTWQNGRELASYTDSDTNVTYTYDASGMRTGKTINGIGKVNYVYENGLLMQMEHSGYILDFSYDANGTPVSVRMNIDGTMSYYYYGVNSRGDIVSIYNVAGGEVVQYTYDAYGKVLSTAYTQAYYTIAELNPLRYRGYVYDRETGFYYLQSRYYDPVTCRFINADTITDGNAGITGNNLFVYCANNPIITIDSSGEFVHILIGAGVGFATSFVSTLVTGGSMQDALISGAFGMASGALCSAFPAAALFIDMGFSAAESAIISAKNGESINDIIVGATISAGTSLLFSTADKYIEVASEAGEKMSKSLPKTTKGNHPNVKKAASKTFLKAQKQYNEASGKALFCYSVGVYASAYEKKLKDRF